MFCETVDDADTRDMDDGEGGGLMGCQEGEVRWDNEDEEQHSALAK